MRIVVGTRSSALARAQSDLVIAALRERRADLDVSVREIRTKGDRSRAPLRKLGEGVFVTAIEDALRAGEIDLAVHSLKDMPTAERDDLVLAAIPPREDPRDVLVTRDGRGLDGLRQGASVGTGSPRRAAQLLGRRPDLEVKELRGNVDTRLRAVAEGALDAVVLALAGLRRLGSPVAAADVLDPEVMLPAPGQGALAVQTRADLRVLRRLLEELDDPPTRAAVRAERAALRELGASCEIALGALGELRDGELHLRLRLVEDGHVREARLADDPAHPERLGRVAAARLREAVRV